MKQHHQVFKIENSVYQSSKIIPLLMENSLNLLSMMAKI